MFSLFLMYPMQGSNLKFVGDITDYGILKRIKCPYSNSARMHETLYVEPGVWAPSPWKRLNYPPCEENKVLIV